MDRSPAAAAGAPGLPEPRAGDHSRRQADEWPDDGEDQADRNPQRNGREQEEKGGPEQSLDE